MDRSCLITLRIDKLTLFFISFPSWTTAKTVSETYLESVNTSVVEFVRFEVGEGIEKASGDTESEVAATMAAALNNNSSC